MKEFSISSNGDRWYLMKDSATDEAYILHRANPSSGGHETRTPVQVFLNIRPFGSERDALIQLMESEEETQIGS